jgi:hypothetical protein
LRITEKAKNLSYGRNNKLGSNKFPDRFFSGNRQAKTAANDYQQFPTEL